MEINFKELSEYKPFIAIPCMDGKMEIDTVRGLLGFQALCYASGLKNELSFVANEALVSRARNQLVAQFMCTNCTHLFFIDSDQGFEGVDILKLISRKKKVIAAPYPKKSLNIQYACSFAVDENNKAMRDGDCKDLIEAGYSGTGFLCIKREVIEKMIKGYPDLHYDNTYDKYFAMNNPDLDVEKMKKYTYSLFDTIQKGDSYYGEDNTFCKRWRDLGGKIWLDSTIDITHVGRQVFRGDIKLFEDI